MAGHLVATLPAPNSISHTGILKCPAVFHAQLGSPGNETLPKFNNL
jgi:hypothetical protein